jgi:acyl transferase domain-containing protein/NAD(P)-dependent dehydrogenase (short-subunit alcohol dehydrogenase family)/acyl carrier protein
LAIIGLGCLFPKADRLEEYWANIRNRVDCITDVPPTHWSAADYLDPDKKARDKVYGARGGFLDPIDFNPMEFGISPRDIEAIDTTQLLGLLAAKQALLDAGYGPDRDFDRERTSVILGVTGALEMVVPLGARLGHPIWRKALAEAGVDPQTADDVVERIAGSYVEWQENSFPGLLGNVSAGRIANRLDLGGTNCVVDAACASSLGALHLAALELAAGRSDMVVTGGLDTFNSIFMYACFSKTPALAASGNARPFDAEGDGTILGEGLGVIVLKRLEDAERDHDKIYAVIRGIGSSSDGKGNAVYAPSPKGQVRAIRRAYQQAGVEPETIELLEAHGTGTVVGDGIELEALLETFTPGDQPAPWCALGSVKSQIGHTKAAAGAAGLIKAALALHHKTLPPTIKVKTPLEPLTRADSPFYLNHQPRPWLPVSGRPRRAALSAFGFGGSNFHLVIEEYGAEKKQIDWDGRVQIVAWSGATPAEISQQLNDLPAPDHWPTFRVQAAATRRRFDNQAPCRLVLAVEKDVTDWNRLKTTALKGLQGQAAAWDHPDGAYYGSGPRPGKLALLFPGQGSQYPGMLRDLACGFPMLFQVLADANDAFALREDDLARTKLSDYIYPVLDLTPGQRLRNEEILKDTRVAQPAIGAVALGLYRVLEYFSLKADLAAGHSYGELVALCASGRYREEDLHQLSRIRGDLMARTNGRQGAMLAVQSGADQAAELITDHELVDLVVANKNTPRQTVISGGAADIEKAEKIFNDHGLHCVRLKVSNAFHSPLMTPAHGPFQDALGRVAFRKARIPVFANSTAEPYPEAEQDARELLAGQLVRPVEFIREITNMHQSGVAAFLEVGPGKVLTGQVKAILENQPIQALAVDASKGARSGFFDLARTLAHLAALGYEPDLVKWDGDFQETPAESRPAGFTVSLCGANQFERKNIKPPVPTPIRASGGPMDNTVNTMKNTRIDTGQVRNPCPVKTCAPSPASAATLDQRLLMGSPAPAPLQEALRLTQANLNLLQQMQTQTADLHRQFLLGQETAQQNLHELISQQQMLLEHTLGYGPGISAPRIASPAYPAGSMLGAPVEAAPQPAAPPLRTSEPDASPREAGNDRERILDLLLGVVSATTGYPKEMLNIDMSLDGDLGIDSIKRVEIFSALSEQLPQAAELGADEIGTLHTLGEVVEFLAGIADQNQPLTKPAAPADPGPDQVAGLLVQLVSTQTGYPVEMLDLDMNMDTDLGIDSIKRVEILSALSEAMPHLPEISSDQLGLLQTLRQVVDFLTAECTPGAAPAAATGPDFRPSSMPETPDQSVLETVYQAIHDLAGYPRETLSPDLKLETDLGFDPVRVVDLVQAVGVSLGLGLAGPGFNGEATIRTLALCFQEAAAGRPNPDCRAATTPTAVDRYLVEPVSLDLNQIRPKLELPPGARIIITEDNLGLAGSLAEELTRRGFKPEIAGWDTLPDQDLPQDLAGLIIMSQGLATDDHLPAAAFRLAQTAGPRLTSGGPTLLATISTMNGSFGFGPGPKDINPIEGSLAGLAKTVHREWPTVSAKALDIDLRSMDLAALAREIVDELLLKGPLEVGLAQGRRRTLKLRRETSAAAADLISLEPGDLVLVSGGARGITADTALALARKWRPTLVLLGRTPVPEDEPAWLASLTDEAAIKKELFQRAPAGTSPKDVERSYRRIAAQREITGNLTRLREAGAQADYLAVDVTDDRAVAEAVSEIRRQYGPIKGLVHGAGILADRYLADKTMEQFQAVYNVKVAGCRALLKAAEGDPLKFMVFFSSSTGRFGRTGQVDYAMANEVLNKTAQREAARRPGCRVAAFNWGPWAGGMVNSALEKAFQKEGLVTIPLAAGAAYLAEEIAAGDPAQVEIVVLGPGSDLPEGELAAPAQPTVLEKILSIDQAPILKSHVLDNQAVFPLALMMEWMVRAGLDDQAVHQAIGLDRLKVHNRLSLDHRDRLRLRITADPARQAGRDLVRPVRLGLMNGLAANTYADGLMVLNLDPMDARPRLNLGPLEPYPHQGRIYEDGRLFHGSDLQGIVSLDGCGPTGITGLVRTSGDPARFIKDEPAQWLTDPLALDSAFQMVILWCWETHGRPALPVSVGRYRQFSDRYPSEAQVRVNVQITEPDGPKIKADLEIIDLDGRLLSRLEEVVCFESEALIEAYRRNCLEPAGPLDHAPDQTAAAGFWPVDN